MSRWHCKRTFGSLFALLILAPSLALAQFDYPQAKKVEVTDDYHGTVVADPYRWLEDTEAADTRAWIEAENEITFAYLHSIPEREWIVERLTELWNYERYTTPFKEGDRYFLYKNDGLQNQSVLYMQKSLEATPKVLLDPNKLSEDGTVALAGLSFSEDGELMVYGVAASGSDWRDLYVRNVATGRDLDDHLEWIKGSGTSWTHDEKGFFYSRYPKPAEGETYLSANLDQQLYYHRIGTPQSQDQLIYERPEDPELRFGLGVTDDGRYGIMYVRRGTDLRRYVYYKDFGDSENPRLSAPVIKLLDDFDAAYSFIGNNGPVFYFRTNLDAPKYRLIAIDTRRPGRENWRTVVPEREDVLQSVTIVNQRFVARYMHDAHSRVRIYSMSGQFERDLELPGIGSVGGISGDREDTEMFYSFASFIYPTTIFRYDFETGETEVFRAPKVDFDRSAYETKQVFYRSKDGARIPMFITHKKGIVLDGSNPTYLYAYGGFNISRTPRFSTSILVWLEMGGVYASANLRGGGEYGEEWHQAGMLDRKQNVFDDFIAAAEYLIAQGYTSTPKLAIGGGSNGGLLVGAVMTQRPELYGAALPAVGVMDMLRFHKFTVGGGWVPEYGSADNPHQFGFLYAYSPYHNLKPAMYPPTMVTTADHDDRVVPGHSFKFAARLQEVQQGDAPVFIRIQTKAGHGAGMPTNMRIEVQADRWAFLVKNLGVRIGQEATH